MPIHGTDVGFGSFSEVSASDREVRLPPMNETGCPQKHAQDVSWGDITIFELDQSVVLSNSLVFGYSCAPGIRSLARH
jgi:hypothetical protein